jgi:Uma2 family endonuclease
VHFGEVTQLAAVPKKTLRSEHTESTVVLNNGDRMEQPEFHFAYEAMPECYRAELIGGIVFEPSPLGYEHGRNDTRLSYLLEHFAAQTQGLEAINAATVILGKKDEVQPDAILRVMVGYGGRSHNVRIKDKLYIEGAPELLAEVAHSSRAIDLHLKKSRYALAGVLEYIVLCLDPLRLYWFDLQSKKDLTADAQGIFKSNVFSGLWLDGPALLERDYKRSMSALNRGMESAEYHEFAARLAKAKEEPAGE